MKEEGNTFYQNKEYLEAAHKYQKGICLFKYMKSNNINWKKEGNLIKKEY